MKHKTFAKKVSQVKISFSDHKEDCYETSLCQVVSVKIDLGIKGNSLWFKFSSSQRKLQHMLFFFHSMSEKFLLQLKNKRSYYIE